MGVTRNGWEWRLDKGNIKATHYSLVKSLKKNPGLKVKTIFKTKEIKNSCIISNL